MLHKIHTVERKIKCMNEIIMDSLIYQYEEKLKSLYVYIIIEFFICVQMES